MSKVNKKIISFVAFAIIYLGLLSACAQNNPTTKKSSINNKQSDIISPSDIITPTKEIIPTPTSAPTPTPTPEPEEPYVIAWMSDTQYYTKYKPEIFTSMTNWIAQNATEMNINYVIHTGDIVEDYDDIAQWEVAKNALAVFDGIVPLFTVAGNHDTYSKRRDKNYVNLFEELNFSELDSYGGIYKDGRGRYDLFDINDEPIILVTISYNVYDSDIKWINEVLDTYSDRTAILAFHGYLSASKGLTTDGKKLCSDVVSVNENVRLVLCGHRHAVAHNAIEFDDDDDGEIDRTVYQLLSNYQSEAEYGSGYLCLLSFDKRAGELNITTYSPYLDDFNYFKDDSGLEEFTIPWGNSN